MSRVAAKKDGSGSDATLKRIRDGERVILRSGGRIVGAVIPIADLRRLQRVEDEEDLRLARVSLKEVRKHGAVPWEKVKAELGLR